MHPGKIGQGVPTIKGNASDSRLVRALAETDFATRRQCVTVLFAPAGKDDYRRVATRRRLDDTTPIRPALPCGPPPPRRARTTDSRHALPIAPNLLARDFAAAAPNRIWLADITYVPTGEGWLYLAAIMDLFSRKIVGWAMRDHLRTELASSALTMAVQRQRPAVGLIHHSDRGVQYAALDYRGALAAAGITASMSRKADCFDNAPMESFFHILKTELVHHRQYATLAEAQRDIFAFIEGFYNRTRLHSAIGYISPIEMELKAA